MTFGERVVLHRKQLKMSRDDLGKKIGTSAPIIGRYERDEIKPSIETAKKIAEALEVSLDYLVGNTDLLLEKNIVSKIVDIQKLGSEDKAHVFALLDAFLQSNKAKKVFAQ